MKQTIFKRGVLDLHEVGKLELTLEGARGDAAIEHFGFAVAGLAGGFLAFDRQGFSLATIEISFCEKPETATEMRKSFSPVRSML